MSYATTDELAVVLKIRNPTGDQTTAMQRVLDAATGEIDSEIDRDDDDPITADTWQYALAAEVNLERAVEHWEQGQAPFGIIGFGAAHASGGIYTAKDSWERHALKLAPLKETWGLA
jgi:hypothetical protein